MQMKLSVANIVNVLNHKYDACLQYADVYHITENLKNGTEPSSMNLYPKTEFHKLL